MTYQPIYRDILETASDTKNCTILPYPSVHPRFGKTYFNRFFGYFQAIDWKKVEFKSLQ